MGFYGNIKNTSKAPFTFDRIFSSRKAMEMGMTSDGVYAGRYVLIEYDKEFSNKEFHQAYHPKNIKERAEDSLILYKDTTHVIPYYVQAKGNPGDVENIPIGDVVYINEIITTYIKSYYIDNTNSANIIKNAELTEGKYYIEIDDVKYWFNDKFLSDNNITLKTYSIDNSVPTDSYAVYQTKKDGCSFYECTGQVSETDNTALFKYISTSTSLLTTPEEGTWANYYNNHIRDIAYYDDRPEGYDGTVWQKVYIDDNEKYIMIADLNAKAPTITVSADAPQSCAQAPHLDISATKDAMDFHMPAQWGFRIKAADNSLSNKGLISDSNFSKDYASFRDEIENLLKYFLVTNTTDNVTQADNDTALMARRKKFEQEKINIYNEYLNRGGHGSNIGRISILEIINQTILNNFADSQGTINGISDFILDFRRILEIPSNSDNDSSTPLNSKFIESTQKYEKCFDIIPAYNGTDIDEETQTTYYLYVADNNNEIKFVDTTEFTVLKLITVLLTKNFPSETSEKIESTASLLLPNINKWILAADYYWTKISSAKSQYIKDINSGKKKFISNFINIYNRILNFDHTNNKTRLEQFINFLVSIIADYEEQLYSTYLDDSITVTKETYSMNFLQVYNKYRETTVQNINNGTSYTVDNFQTYLKDENGNIANDSFVNLLRNKIGILNLIYNAYIGLKDISNIADIMNKDNLEKKNNLLVTSCNYALEAILDLSVLSDSNTQWITYHKDTPYYYNHINRQWDTDESLDIPADIFFNKDGFKSDIRTKIDETVMDDEILITPTGYGQTLDENGNWGNYKYNKEEGTIFGEKKEAPDVQEMSIHLPSLGNAMSDFWDIVYGEGDADEEGFQHRRTEVGWAPEDEVDYTKRMQWIEPIENGGLGYTPENLATVAGVINSTQDLIGRNIVVDPQEQTNLSYFNSDSSNVYSLDNDHIYYLSDEKQFYRRKWNYDFDYDFESDITTRDIYKNKVQGYEKITLVNPDNVNYEYFYKDGVNYIWDSKYYSDKSYYTITPSFINFTTNNEYLLLEEEHISSVNTEGLISNSQVASKEFSKTKSTDEYNWDGTYYSSDVFTDTECYLFQDNKYYKYDSNTNRIELVTTYDSNINYYIKTKDPEAIISGDIQQKLIVNRGDVSYLPVPVRDISETGYEIYISQKNFYTVMRQCYQYYNDNNAWPFLLETTYTSTNVDRTDYDNTAKENIAKIGALDSSIIGSETIYYQVTYFKDLDLNNDVWEDTNEFSGYAYEFGKFGYFRQFDITQTPISKYEPGNYYYPVYSTVTTDTVVQYILDTTEGEPTRKYCTIKTNAADFQIYKRNTYYYKENEQSDEFILSTAPSSSEQSILGYIKVSDYNILVEQHPDIVLNSGKYLLQTFDTTNKTVETTYELAIPQPSSSLLNRADSVKWDTYYIQTYNTETQKNEYTPVTSYQGDVDYYVAKQVYSLPTTVTPQIYIDYEFLKNTAVLSNINTYTTDAPFRYVVANPQPTLDQIKTGKYFVYSEGQNAFVSPLSYTLYEANHSNWVNDNAYCVKEYLFNETNNPNLYSSLDYNYVLASTKGSFNTSTAYWTANSEKTVFTPVLNPIADKFGTYYVRDGNKGGQYDYYIIYKGQQGYNEGQQYYIKNPTYYVTQDYLNYAVGQRWDSSICWDNYLLSTTETYDANEDYYSDAFGSNKVEFYEKGKYYNKYEPNVYYIEDKTKHYILDIRYKIAEQQPTSQTDIDNNFYYIKASNVVKATEFEANTIYYLDPEATTVATEQPNEHNFYTYYIKDIEKAKIWNEDLNYVNGVGLTIPDSEKTFANFQAGNLYLESFLPAVSYDPNGVYYQWNSINNEYELVDYVDENSNDPDAIKAKGKMKQEDFIVIDYYKLIRYNAKYNVDGQIYYVAENNNDTTYLYTNNKFIYDRAYVYQANLANNNKYYIIADIVDNDITYYHDRYGLNPVNIYKPDTYYITSQSAITKATNALNEYNINNTKFYLDDEGKEEIYFEDWTSNMYYYEESYDTYEYISKFDVQNGIQAYSALDVTNPIILTNDDVSEIDLLVYEPGKYYKEEYKLASIYDPNETYYLNPDSISRVSSLSEREFNKTDYYIQTATPQEEDIYTPIIEYVDQDNYYYSASGELLSKPTQNEFYNGTIYYEKITIPSDYEYTFTREYNENITEYYKFDINNNSYQEVEVNANNFGIKDYYIPEFLEADAFNKTAYYTEEKPSARVNIDYDDFYQFDDEYYIITDFMSADDTVYSNNTTYYSAEDEEAVVNISEDNLTAKKNHYYTITNATTFASNTSYCIEQDGKYKIADNQPTSQDDFTAKKNHYYIKSIDYVLATDYADDTEYFIDTEGTSADPQPTNQDEFDAGTYYIINSINYIPVDNYSEDIEEYYIDSEGTLANPQPTSQNDFDELLNHYYIVNSASIYDTTNSTLYYIANEDQYEEANPQPTGQTDFDELLNHYYIAVYDTEEVYHENVNYYTIENDKYVKITNPLERLANTYYYINSFNLTTEYDKDAIYYIAQNDDGIADPQPQSQEDISLGFGYYVKTSLNNEQTIYQIALEWKDGTTYYNKNGSSLGQISESEFNNRQKIYYSKSNVITGYTYTYNLANRYDADKEYYIKTSTVDDTSYQLVGKLTPTEFAKTNYYIHEYNLDFAQNPDTSIIYYFDNKGTEQITTAFWQSNKYLQKIVKTRFIIDNNINKTANRQYYYDEFGENLVYFKDMYKTNKYYFTTLTFVKDTNEDITPYQMYYSSNNLNSLIRVDEYMPAKFYILSEEKYYRIDDDYYFDSEKTYYLDADGHNLSHITADYELSYDSFMPNATYCNKINNIYSPIANTVLCEYEPRKYYWASDTNSQLIKNVRLISEKDLNSLDGESRPKYKRFYLEPMEGFSNSYNTITGLILRVNQMLNSGDTATRDLTTLQGALNTLEDEIRRLQAYDYATVYELNETITNLKLEVKDTIKSANALISLLNSGELAYRDDLETMYQDLINSMTDADSQLKIFMEQFMRALKETIEESFTSQLTALNQNLTNKIDALKIHLEDQIEEVAIALKNESEGRQNQDKVLLGYIEALQEWSKNPTIPMPKPQPIPIDFWPVPVRDPFHRKKPRAGHPDGRPWFRPHPRPGFKFDPNNPHNWLFDDLYDLAHHRHIHPHEPMPRPIPLPPPPEDEDDYRNVPITEVLYHLCMQNFFPFFAGAEGSADTGIGTGEKTDKYADWVEDMSNKAVFDSVRFSLVSNYSDIFSNFAITNDESYYDPEKERVYVDIDVSFKTKPGVKGMFGDYYGMPHGMLRLANGYTHFNLPASLEECALTISETTRSGRTYNARFIRMYNDTPGVIKISTNIDLEPNTLYTLHISGNMRCIKGY